MPSPILDSAEFKQAFDPLLQAELERHVARASTFTNDQEAHSLLTQFKEIALAGGKRIRPYAAYLMYCTAGGYEKSVFQSLVALEIFHVFALVHDDIIDRGTMRHGRQSLHEFARKLMSDSTENAGHIADSLALLVGDLAFSWSRETFANSTTSTEANALFNDMIYAVVLGQMLDVAMTYTHDPSEEKIMEKTFLKTAQYTFIYPFQIGAALAGKHAESLDWCTRMGTALGTAFQLQDDLLDIVGTENNTGKRPFQDVSESQHTVFTAFIRTRGSVEDKEELQSFFGKTIDSDSLGAVKTLFERSGAVAYGKGLIEGEFVKAQDLLSEVPVDMNADAYSAWDALLNTMEQRTS